MTVHELYFTEGVKLEESDHPLDAMGVIQLALQAVVQTESWRLLEHPPGKYDITPRKFADLNRLCELNVFEDGTGELVATDLSNPEKIERRVIQDDGKFRMIAGSKYGEEGLFIFSLLLWQGTGKENAILQAIRILEEENDEMEE